jgi:hypothetical protein
MNRALAMTRALAGVTARVPLYFAAGVGCIVAGMYLHAELSQLWGWSSSIRQGLPQFLWTIGACLGGGSFALRRIGARSAELLCAWLMAEVCITLYVGSERKWFGPLFWDLWLVLSIPVSLWVPGIALGAGILAIRRRLRSGPRHAQG